MNDWDLEKSYKKIEQVIYRDDNKVEDETTESANPDESSDSEIIDENNE